MSGAFVPSAGHPELLIAKGGSETTATVVQKVFTQVAAAEHRPLEVTDVVSLGENDPTGQALFFLLVAVSIGSYASVAVIGGAGAVLATGIRALIGVGTSFVVSILGLLFAGPVFGFVDHDLAAVWALSWLYSLGIVWVGTGLHTFFKRWTTLSMTIMFVALNFTSCGGIFEPALQPGFFGALHAFWNGAGFLEAARNIVYFDGLDVGGYVLRLALWVVAGALLLVAAYAFERRGKRPAAATPQPTAAEPARADGSVPPAVPAPAAVSAAQRAAHPSARPSGVQRLSPQAAAATGWSHAYYHGDRKLEEELEENAPA
ncbi:YhgE/Pip domain-containing protein [Streptomyces jeddahensis]|uniref:ABC-2 family transporter protein n=1 Tax=Streptomyces jeddahensis TaxID=1716141 RepID=A0A177HNH1_9ACTN|nr:hypothetical protein STSP_44960 [Streptomyces jeddahensis]